MKYKFEDIAFNSTEKKKPVESDKSHYIGLEHLDSQCLTVNRYGSDVAPIGEKLIMKKGDVLFGKRRAYQKKVAIAPFDGIFSAHGFVLRPKENVIDKNFFPFFISSDYFLDKAISISVGSLSPTINWSDLKVLEFELPDLEEQKRLANILWKIENIKSSIKEQIKKSEDLLFNYYSHIYGNMDGNYQSIKSMVEIQNKSEIKAGDQIPYGKYKFFTSGEKEGYYNSYLLNGQFLILNTGGSMLCQYYNGPFAYSTDALVIKPKEDLIKFIYYHLLCNQKYYDEKFFRGSGLRHLNKKEFLSSEIKIPEKNKIIYIVNFMDNISKIIASLNNQKIYLQELERKIIKEALNV